mgnify:CR=1 FL=1
MEGCEIFAGVVGWRPSSAVMPERPRDGATKPRCRRRGPGLPGSRGERRCILPVENCRDRVGTRMRADAAPAFFKPRDQKSDYANEEF